MRERDWSVAALPGEGVATSASDPTLLVEPDDVGATVIEPMRLSELFAGRDVRLRHHFSPVRVCTYGGDSSMGGHNDELMTDAEFNDTAEVLEKRGKEYAPTGQWVRLYVLYHFHYDGAGRLRMAPPYLKAY